MPSAGCRLRPLCTDHNARAQLVHDEDDHRYNNDDHQSMIILFFVLFSSRSAASKTVPAESQACRDHGALLSNEGGTFEAKS